MSHHEPYIEYVFIYVLKERSILASLLSQDTEISSTRATCLLYEHQAPPVWFSRLQTGQKVIPQLMHPRSSDTIIYGPHLGFSYASSGRLSPFLNVILPESVCPGLYGDLGSLADYSSS